MFAYRTGVVQELRVESITVLLTFGTMSLIWLRAGAGGTCSSLFGLLFAEFGTEIQGY